MSAISIANPAVPFTRPVATDSHTSAVNSAKFNAPSPNHFNHLPIALCALWPADGLSEIV